MEPISGNSGLALPGAARYATAVVAFDPKMRENYGKGVVEIDENDIALLGPTEVKQKLLAALKSPQFKPPVLPAVGAELLAMAKRPNVDIRQIQTLLQQDPMLAAKLLRIANSPVYAARQPIVSLQDAIVRLGLQTTADIFFEAAAQLKVFRAPGYTEKMETLRKHSILTAHLARSICKATGKVNELAFLCGLLHDVGIAISLIVLSDGVKSPPAFDDVWSAVQMAHEQAGGILIDMWKLPGEIRNSVVEHHRFSKEGSLTQTTAAIILAESITSRLGASIEADEDMLLIAKARETLGLNDAIERRLMEDAKMALSAIAATGG